MAIAKSRNIQNSVWNLINVTLYPIIFLALTPWFINRMGENMFGTWMILNSIMYISVQLLHFGIGPSLTIIVAELRGKKRPGQLNRFYNSALNFTALLSFFALVLAIVGLVVLPTEWFQWDGIVDYSDLKLAFIATLALIGIKLFEQVFIGFYKGFEEYDTLTKFNFSYKIITLTIQAMLVYIGYGISAIIITALGASVLLIVFQYLYSLRYLQAYTWSRALDKRIFKRIGVYGFWSWSQTLIAILSFQLDRLLVASFLGTGVVAYYSIASMIANHLHMALEAIVGWIFPAVSRIANEKKDSKPLFFTVQNLLLTIAITGLALLYLIREPVFTLWLGHERYTMVIPFLELFILFEVFYVLSITPKFYLNGLARLKLITFIEVSYKSFGIMLMAVLFYFIRTAESLIWGQIISLLITMPILLLVLNAKIIHRSWFKDGLAIAIPNIMFFVTLMATEVWMQWIMGCFTFCSVIVFYLRHQEFNLKRILE